MRRSLTMGTWRFFLRADAWRICMRHFLRIVFSRQPAGLIFVLCLSRAKTATSSFLLSAPNGVSGVPSRCEGSSEACSSGLTGSYRGWVLELVPSVMATASGSHYCHLAQQTQSGHNRHLLSVNCLFFPYATIIVVGAENVTGPELTSPGILEPPMRQSRVSATQP